MSVHGVWGQIEHLCYLFVGTSLGDETDDALLGGCEARQAHGRHASRRRWRWSAHTEVTQPLTYPHLASQCANLHVEPVCLLEVLRCLLHIGSSCEHASGVF